MPGCGRSRPRLTELLPLAARDRTGLAQIERILDFAERIRAAADDPAWLERELLFGAPRIRSNDGAQKHWDDANDCRRTKGLFVTVKERLAAVAGALRAEALLGVLPLAEGFVRNYEARRRERGVADFDDLLVWARDLLGQSPEALGYFRRRFRAILVDEFQDTDPLQAEIALLLSSDGAVGDWLALTPGPGRLVVVGDPKQSIYRFRRADIEVYDRIKHGPLEPGVRELRQNFRSVAGVLDLVNDVFDRAFVEEVGVQPRNVPLEVGDARLADESRCVVVVPGVAGEKAAESYAEEARLVAAAVRAAIDEGWTVRDGERERPAGYGDVVCLYRARTGTEELEEALTAQGIPFRVEGSRSFFRRQEVRDLAHVLRAIDDPTDALSLFGALRSAAFSCSDEDVYRWTLAGARLDYRHVPEHGPELVRDALLCLRDLRDLRARVSLAELVRETIARTRLVESTMDAPGGTQAAANLLKLVERARAFSAAGGGGLRDFARWLSESEAAAAEEAEAGIADEHDQVVRLMTIHSSKGLEFPIVALFGLFSEPGARRGPIPHRDGNRLDLRIGVNSGTDWEANFDTPGYESAADEEKRFEDAELRRLLYVALTRARDRLIVPALRADKEEKNGPLLAELLPSLGDCFTLDPEALPEPADDEEAEPEPVDTAAVEAALAERAEWATGRAELLDRARAELVVVPATAREGAEPHASILAAGDGPLILGEGPPREVGEALHKVMELCDLARPESLPSLVESICAVAGIPEAAGEVLKLAQACVGSPVVARALASGRHWREVPYTVPIENGYGTGRIDLVFEQDGGLVVVDWKTDAVEPEGVEAAAEEHRPQAEAYAEALTAATGREVKEIVLGFPRAGREVRIR
ncbi:MAG: 3'-5' exonuclease [Gaiellales bacterium]